MPCNYYLKILKFSRGDRIHDSITIGTTKEFNKAYLKIWIEKSNNYLIY